MHLASKADNFQFVELMLVRYTEFNMNTDVA